MRLHRRWSAGPKWRTALRWYCALPGTAISALLPFARAPLSNSSCLEALLNLRLACMVRGGIGAKARVSGRGASHSSIRSMLSARVVWASRVCLERGGDNNIVIVIVTTVQMEK